MSGFPIIHVQKDTETVIPNENCYLIGSNGAFKRVTNEFYEATVKSPTLPDLAELKEEVKIHVTKFPEHMLNRIHAFFADVYVKYKGEAVVLLLFNPLTRKWAVKVPPQDTKGMSVKYDLDKGEALIWIPGNGVEEMTIAHLQTEPVPEGLRDYRMFGSIHSHCDAGAFHSGTDDKDEFMFDGLHITLGKVSQNTPEIACRWMLAGQWWKAEPSGCIAFNSERPNVDGRWMERVTEVNYASGYGSVPTGYGYQGTPINGYRPGPGPGAGFDMPLSRHGHWDEDDYFNARHRTQLVNTETKPTKTETIVGKTEAPSEGAGKESGKGDKQSTSPDSKPADGAGDVPPIQRLIDHYWTTNGVGMSWEIQALVEVCEVDLEIMEFAESLLQPELERLLANPTVLKNFLCTASAESYEKYQIVSEQGAESEISKQRLEEAVEEIRETNVPAT